MIVKNAYFEAPEPILIVKTHALRLLRLTVLRHTCGGGAKGPSAAFGSLRQPSADLRSDRGSPPNPPEKKISQISEQKSVSSDRNSRQLTDLSAEMYRRTCSHTLDRLRGRRILFLIFILIFYFLLFFIYFFIIYIFYFYFLFFKSLILFFCYLFYF